LSLSGSLSNSDCCQLVGFVADLRKRGWKHWSPALGLKAAPELLGYKHGVDHVNDAVATLDVGLGHVRAVYHYLAALDHDLHFLAVHGLGLTQLDHILRHHVASDYVVGEDGNQLLLVLGLEQIFYGSSRPFRECLIGRREDGKRTGSLERIH